MEIPHAAPQTVQAWAGHQQPGGWRHGAGSATAVARSNCRRYAADREDRRHSRRDAGHGPGLAGRPAAPARPDRGRAGPPALEKPAPGPPRLARLQPRGAQAPAPAQKLASTRASGVAARSAAYCAGSATTATIPARLLPRLAVVTASAAVCWTPGTAVIARCCAADNGFGTVITASAPACCQDCATSPRTTAPRTIPANDTSDRASTMAKQAAPSGRYPRRPGQAQVRGHARPPAGDQPQRPHHQRVAPQHDDRDRDGDKHRCQAGIQVTTSGTRLLVAQHQQTADRSENSGRLGDELPHPGQPV